MIKFEPTNEMICALKQSIDIIYEKIRAEINEQHSSWADAGWFDRIAKELNTAKQLRVFLDLIKKGE